MPALSIGPRLSIRPARQLEIQAHPKYFHLLKVCYSLIADCCRSCRSFFLARAISDSWASLFLHTVCERCRCRRAFGRLFRQRFESSSSRSSRRRTTSSRGRKPSTRSSRVSTTLCPSISSRQTGSNSLSTLSESAVDHLVEQ